MLKKKLEDNKIYFETLAASSISVMAIIVSFCSYLISEQSLTLSKLDHLPVISAEFRHEIRENERPSHSLIISNSGAAMYEFKAYLFSFLDIQELQVVRLDEEVKKVPLKGAMIPLENYLSLVSHSSNDNQGIISKYFVMDGSKLDRAINSFASKKAQNARSFGDKVKRYLFVSYNDKFGVHHNKYFKFSPAGTSIPLINQDGKLLLSKHNEDSDMGSKLDYRDPTTAELIRLWEKLAEYRVSGS